MNHELHNLVVTSIKRGTNNQAIATTRSEENNAANLSQNIKDKLTTIFHTTGLRLGRFNTEPVRPFFAARLDSGYNQDALSFNDFRGFSAGLGDLLAQKLNDGRSQNAKDGFLLTYYYSTRQVEEGSDDEFTSYFLGVVFLHRLDGVDIDAVDLDLRDIEQINLDSLNLGACIDMAQYMEESIDPAKKPIAFKIGRGSEVRVYFQEFIGCSEPSNSKVDSQNLIAAVEYACSDFGMSDEEKFSASEYAQNYCRMILDNGQNSLSLEAFAHHVFRDENRVSSFVQMANSEFHLGESVGVDKTEVGKFGTITIHTEKVKIKLSKSALSEGIIRWDSEEGCLKVFGLSDDDINRLQLNS